MSSFSETLQMAVWNVFHRASLVDLLDIILVACVIYALLSLTRNTRGSAVLKGLVLLLAITLLSSLLGLTALNWLLMFVVNNGAVVLIVLFQPEIRQVLERLGRRTIRGSQLTVEQDESKRIIREIVMMTERLSRRKVGALIVFEQKTGLQDVIDTGIRVDARVTSALLENIFEPNTPLHDGAVVVRGGRVESAACILTLTENRNISKDLGTRHRAGIGVTETTDALVLIVSEETGIVSIASGGALQRPITPEKLEAILETVYAPRQRSLGSVLKGILGRRNEK